MLICRFFFFNDTATTEIYTLSLHDALPISRRLRALGQLLEEGVVDAGHLTLGLERDAGDAEALVALLEPDLGDRKSTRLNSSHANISYAVFCLKKKKK